MPFWAVLTAGSRPPGTFFPLSSRFCSSSRFTAKFSCSFGRLEVPFQPAQTPLLVTSCLPYLHATSFTSPPLQGRCGPRGRGRILLIAAGLPGRSFPPTIFLLVYAFQLLVFHCTSLPYPIGSSLFTRGGSPLGTNGPWEGRALTSSFSTVASFSCASFDLSRACLFQTDLLSRLSPPPQPYHSPLCLGRWSFAGDFLSIPVSFFCWFFSEGLIRHPGQLPPDFSPPPPVVTGTWPPLVTPTFLTPTGPSGSFSLFVLTRSRALFREGVSVFRAPSATPG